MRVYRRGKSRRDPLAPMVRRYFETGSYDGMTGPGWLAAFQISGQVMNVATRGEGKCAEWAEHGAAITAAWAAEHPGTRPFAWWAIDAPAPRLVIAGRVRVPSRIPPRAVWRLNLGIPFWLHELAPGASPVSVESEPRYLARHDLLSRAERRALAPEDFEPELVNESESDDEPDEWVTPEKGHRREQ